MDVVVKYNAANVFSSLFTKYLYTKKINTVQRIVVKVIISILFIFGSNVLSKMYV